MRSHPLAVAPSLNWIWDRKEFAIAVLAILAIALHLALAFGSPASKVVANIPLWVALVLGGLPLVGELIVKLFRREFGSDLLAGISIVTSVILGEYLAGALVVLMLSGGETIEAFAVSRASSVLQALANRMPSAAHRLLDGQPVPVDIHQVEVGDEVLILPHEISPVDGVVINGRGVMDESYLTGEPYMMSKTPGSQVLSGAINGDSALTIRAEKKAVDSRYAKIMEVMHESEQKRPRLRRLGDQLGAFYTPIAVALALVAWLVSGEATRFLAVLVVATPCPLLIGIPVAIIGSISLAARRGIIVRNPAVLETVDSCRTVIFDKTGTLTYGTPTLTTVSTPEGVAESEVLQLAASIENFSKHPLAKSVIHYANDRGIERVAVERVSEKPGQGLSGNLLGHELLVTSRHWLATNLPDAVSLLPAVTAGLECVIVIDGQYAATFQFRDAPRKDGRLFIDHLGPQHKLDRVLLVSGDRESEVEYLAEKVGIANVYANQSPEQKVAIVRRETESAKTIFVGDGINDAPALTTATVGLAFGQNSDVTTEAAGAVIMDSSLQRVDEFLHISHRMRRIALQSAVGGMILSVIGMLIAACGYLPPVAGAVTQEVIDVVAVLNALRAAFPPRSLTDY